MKGNSLSRSRSKDSDQPDSVKGIFYRRENSLHFSGYRQPLEFANFPQPDRKSRNPEPYLKKEYSIGIQTKRGCPFACAYCTYPYLQGNNLLIRPLESVVDELETLSKQYGVKSVSFVDSVFNVPQDYAVDLLQAMSKRGLDLKWKVSTI